VQPPRDGGWRFGRRVFSNVVITDHRHDAATEQAIHALQLTPPQVARRGIFLYLVLRHLNGGSPDDLDHPITTRDHQAGYDPVLVRHPVVR